MDNHLPMAISLPPILDSFEHRDQLGEVPVVLALLDFSPIPPDLVLLGQYQVLVVPDFLRVDHREISPKLVKIQVLGPEGKKAGAPISLVPRFAILEYKQVEYFMELFPPQILQRVPSSVDIAIEDLSYLVLVRYF